MELSLFQQWCVELPSSLTSLPSIIMLQELYHLEPWWVILMENLNTAVDTRKLLLNQNTIVSHSFSFLVRNVFWEGFKFFKYNLFQSLQLLGASNSPLCLKWHFCFLFNLHSVSIWSTAWKVSNLIFSGWPVQTGYKLQCNTKNTK